ncbi:MAG: hypothetical protein ACYC5Q_11435 [Thermoleophilia bacterium]
MKTEAAMTLHVTLGEPLWRERAARELTIEIEPGATRRLRDLPGTIGLDEWTAEGLLAIVNDRLVPAGDAETLLLRDGDHVVLQLVLAGG